MGKLEALLFDVDGTLAETEAEGHLPAFNLAFCDAGLNWEWSKALYGELLAVTGGKERIRAYIERFHPEFDPQGGRDSLIARLHQAKNRYYAEIMAQGGVHLRPGIIRLLKEAREHGLRLAIATTTSYENVTALLEHSPIPESFEWFEVIAAGDVVPAKKPAPDIYWYALDKLQLRPESCLAIEDSRNGLRATLAAHLKTLVTISTYTREEDFSGALTVLDHLGDPGQPCRVLAGMNLNAPYVDVSALRRLHNGET